MTMENPEKSRDLIDQIFELEKQIDMRRAFIEQNQSNSSESQDLRNRVENFKLEIKKLTSELIQLRLRHREENK